MAVAEGGVDPTRGPVTARKRARSPLPLTHADVMLIPVPAGYEIEARVRTTAQTGVEMEALTAVSVAALTIYGEFRSISSVIDRFPPLRRLDSLGRVSEDLTKR